MTNDQRIALNIAIDNLQRNGNAFDELGALTILQEMAVETHEIALLKTDAMWLKAVIQNPLHDGETGAEALRRERIWNAFGSAGVHLL